VKQVRIPVFDAPDSIEIVRKVARFLEDEVRRDLPDARLSYRVRVAANLLRLVERELAAHAGAVDAEGRVATVELTTQFGGLRALTEALRTGERSILEPDVFRVLSEYTRMRVSITSREAPP
jgi:hypothetical protein